MPIYIYKATDKAGNLISGKMEAKSEEGIVNKLRTSRLLPVSIKLEQQKGDGSSIIPNFFLFSRVGGKDILNFTQQLSTLMDAGLNLDRSLTIMLELCEKDSLKKIVENIQKSVHSGSTFSDALSRYPGIFTKLYVSMVRAGEEGGVLEIILSRLAYFQESTERLRENVKSAMIYPSLLTAVGGATVIVLITYVIPKFARIFADMGQAIPLPTKILLNISGLLINYWWLIGLSIFIFTIIVKMYTSTQSGRLFMDTMVLRLPLIGAIQVKIQVSRFSRTLGTLMKSGVALLNALSITKEVLSNSVMTKAMSKISKRVKEGSIISEPLKESGVFPALAIHMIRVGEETGKIEDMLLKVADTYDNDVENSVKRFIALLEPFMILFMGLVVGFIVISMLMAIFSMNDLPI